MITRDIHSAKETVDIALYDLKETIDLARKTKNKVICLIVGYGSTSKTHKIKTAVLERLEEYKNKNFIKGYILGNHLDIFCKEYQNFKYRDLIPSEDKSRKNPGAIYIVV